MSITYFWRACASVAESLVQKWFQVFRDISRSIQARVIGYYEYLYLKKGADTSNSFLEILPDIMKVEFSYSTHLVIISKVRFLLIYTLEDITEVM